MQPSREQSNRAQMLSTPVNGYVIFYRTYFCRSLFLPTDFPAEKCAVKNLAQPVLQRDRLRLSEGIYQECIELEFNLRQIPFVPQPELRVFYKSNELKTKVTVHGIGRMSLNVNV